MLASPVDGPDLARAIEAASLREETHACGTHPTMRDRARALASFPSTVGAPDARPALDLLDGVHELELDLLGGMLARGALSPEAW